MAVALGFIIFAVIVVGDRYCDIELQNTRRGILSIKTVRSTGPEWTTIIDSVALAPGEKLEIGTCVNCITFDESEFHFDAIVIFPEEGKSQLILRKELPDYLLSLNRIDCVVFQVQ